MNFEVINTDVVVVGSGAAGLMAAIKAHAAGADVCVLEKAVLGKSGSTVGAEQTAAVGPWSPPEDSPDVHFRDSVIGGRFINDQALTRLMADQAGDRIADLVEWGMRFDQNEDGSYALADLGGHSYRRQLTFKGDRTGLGIINVLQRRTRQLDIGIYQDVLTIDLIVQDGAAVGITAVDLQTGELLAFGAKAVILATGGSGQLYPITSNSRTGTGDGFAMALRAGLSACPAQAGVPLQDMEQVQFYPTGLAYPPSMRGICINVVSGAKMFNGEGERFMRRYDPDNMEMTVRDVLSQAMWSEIDAGRASPHGGVYLDQTQLPKEQAALVDDIARILRERGVEMFEEQLEVAPTAHFMMGGVAIDPQAQTELPGLYAAGEVAGGTHGANRLGNNALPEALVFGAIAGQEAADFAAGQPLRELKADLLEAEVERITEPLRREAGDVRAIDLRRQIHEVMWNQVGVVRREEDLADAAATLREIRRDTLPRVGIRQKDLVFNWELVDYHEVNNMLLAGEAIARSAWSRKESRGAHYVADYPERDDENWLVNTIVRLDDDGLHVSRRPANLVELHPE